MRQCTPHSGLLVETKSSKLIDNVALIDLLPHVSGDFIKQLDGRLTKDVLFIVGQVECKSHHVLLPVLLDDCTDLSHDLDSPIAHIFLVIVQQVIQKWENCATDLLVTHLSEILIDEADQGCKLIEQGFFNI